MTSLKKIMIILAVVVLAFIGGVILLAMTTETGNGIMTGELQERSSWNGEEALPGQSYYVLDYTITNVDYSPGIDSSFEPIWTYNGVDYKPIAYPDGKPDSIPAGEYADMRAVFLGPSGWRSWNSDIGGDLGRNSGLHLDLSVSFAGKIGEVRVDYDIYYYPNYIGTDEVTHYPSEGMGYLFVCYMAINDSAPAVSLGYGGDLIWTLTSGGVTYEQVNPPYLKGSDGGVGIKQGGQAAMIAAFEVPEDVAKHPELATASVVNDGDPEFVIRIVDTGYTWGRPMWTPE